MRIDSPIMTNTKATGSFTGSFDGVITAESFNSPGLGIISGSSQIVISSTTGYSTFSSSLAADIATNTAAISNLDSNYTTDVELNASSSALITGYTNADTTLSSSLAADIATNSSAISNLGDTYATDAELNASSSALITAYGNADTTLSSSLAADIATNASDINTLEGKTLFSGSIQVDHDATTNFVANEHVDHSGVSITAGSGLTGGGDITTTRTINVGQGTGITVGANDISTNDSEIVHDDLSGFVANEHINHSSVTLTAGDGLSGGGDITTSRTFAVDATVLRTTGDSVFSGSAQVDHDATTNFVANEHIDHTSVSITAGSGLTGGGTIAATRTINVGQGDGISVTADAIAVDSTVLRTTGDNVISGSSQVTLSSVSGYVANENVDHSTVSITAGAGLTGGGDITTTRTVNVGAGTGVTVNANDVAIGQDVATTANVTFGSVSVTNDVTISGDLTVLGDATQLQVSALNVEDINITIASGAADSAAANGAGITIAGADESLTWDHGNSRFNFSDDLNVAGNITLTGTVDGVDIDALNTTVSGIDTSVPAIIDSSGTPAFNTGITKAEVLSILNVEDGADVTDTDNVTAAGALMDSEVDADIKTLSLPANTTISTFGASLVDDADAATARTTLGVDAAGTDNSTDVTLAGAYDYITISGQTITRNQITNDDLAGSIANAKLANSSITINGSAVSLGGTRTLVTDDIAEDGSPVNLWYTDARVKTKLSSDNVVSGSATQVRTFLNVENGADVTDTDNVTAAGALMDSEVDADIKTLSLPANTTISAFGKTLVDDADAAAARTTLGVDAAGTDNSTDVTLVTTSHNYLSISGQAITLGEIDISDDTNLAVSDTTGQTGINMSLTGDTISGTLVGLGTSADVQFDSLGIGTAAPGTTGVIRATNDIVAYYSSDERLKDNISEIPNALEKVESLRGIEFDWNDNQEVYGGHDIGVIAQDVEAVLPEIVETRDNGYKAVKYEKLTAVLIQAVKELSARVKELESK